MEEDEYLEAETDEDRWLIVHTPDGPLCWNLGSPTDDELEPLINAARLAAGVPANEDWIQDGSGFAVMLTRGAPHDTLLARATIGAVAELRAADRAAVEEHAAGRRAAAHERSVAAATNALAGLPPEVLAAVLAHPDLAEHVAAAAEKGG